MTSAPEHLALRAPLSGVLVPLETIPDPAFAQRLVGDGVSIDPLDDVLVAPADGVVTFIHPSRHAVVLTLDGGIEILLHIGLETVGMRGDGFQALVAEGDRVAVGDRLIAFDQDKIIAGAVSLLTQMVVSTMDGIVGLIPAEGLVTAAQDTAMTIFPRAAARRVAPELAATADEVTSELVAVPNPTGLHARPGAVLSALAKEFPGKVWLSKGDRRADAKSVTGIMTLNVAQGDRVAVTAAGQGAAEFVARVVAAIRGGLGEHLGKATPEAPATPTPAEPDDPNRITAVAASPGVALGVVVRLEQQDIAVDRAPSGTPAQERERLGQAIEIARADLASLESQIRFEAGEVRAEIFAAHRELIEDPALVTAAEAGIERGDSAAYAWKTGYCEVAEQLAGLDSELMRARASDIRDVGTRVLRILTGTAADVRELPEGAIIVADDLTPSQTVGLDRSKVVGIATVSGGKSSHAAILAQSMGIPAVAGAEGRLLDLAENTAVVVDGDRGCVLLNLSDEEVAAIQEERRRVAELKADALSRAAEPAITTDGHRVEVVANVGGLGDVETALANGAEGVGLLRCEFVFMARTSMPTEEDQRDQYRQVAGAFAPQHKLVVRTLDVGGDKPLPYMPMPGEENPFLGMRGVRIGLDQPSILRPQLRAILEAAGHGAQVHIMFPMIATLEEFRAAKAMVEQERAALGAPRVPVGLMVEVPTVAMMSEQFAREADFFSIGTNDLTQYAMAMDRGHPKLASQVDALNPGVLSLIKATVDGAHRHGTWVGGVGRWPPTPAPPGSSSASASTSSAASSRLSRPSRRSSAAPRLAPARTWRPRR